MQNIDPVYFLFPVVVIAICAGLIIYWRKKRSFAGAVLVYSLIAYAGAIALKYIVQIPTIQAFTSITGGSLAALGVYYGLQTVVFEVGGAYVVARYAVSHNKFKAKDAEGYGLGLAFWENAIYIGALTLINYIIYYAILGSGSSGGAAKILYSALPQGLFASPSVAFVSVGYSILERVSSILIHFSWGFLVVLAAVYKRKLFLGVALPMGLIDFIVPFAPKMGVALFEIVIFALSLFSLIVAMKITSNVRAQHKDQVTTTSPQA